MIRSAVSKVMWVGRATVFLVGLAVILALLFGVASMAFAQDGRSFILGERNLAQSLTTLVNQGRGPALSLEVGSGAPLKVNSTTRVAKLNADQVDNLEGNEMLGPRGYAHITPQGTIDSAYTSQGIESIVIPTGASNSNLYCFDLTFTPHVAVGSPYATNAGIVAVVTKGTPLNDHLNSCPADNRDAAVRTLGSGGGPENFNFQIMFV